MIAYSSNPTNPPTTVPCPTGTWLHLQAVQHTPAGAWGEVKSLLSGPWVVEPWGVRLATDAQGGTVVVWAALDGADFRVMVTTS